MSEAFFTSREVLPGVHHIQETAMGVCFTLIIGEKQALLVDAGYGLHDVAAFVETLTSKPVTLLLTHGHHDHVIGARWFRESCMFAEDQPDFALYTRPEKRQEILKQALSKGVDIDGDAYVNAPIPMPLAMEEKTIDLGGLTVQVMHIPGHTPGSAVCYVPEHKLLLTADNWNPCTWLFFPAALPAEEMRDNQLRRLSPLLFEKVLCSHQPMLFDRSDWENFFAGLTDECLKNAPPVDTGKAMGIDTHQASPCKDMIFVFDWNKTAFARKGR
jgi:glyoxylase-like metal-dependent hydrolase (beta-lactamase superfamily II)